MQRRGGVVDQCLREQTFRYWLEFDGNHREGGARNNQQVFSKEMSQNQSGRML